MDEMDDTDSVVDGDYLGAYSRFFTEFVARVNPDDQLPVKVSAYDVNENELVGEVIGVTLQYLNKTYCPPSLQSYIVHLVIQAIKSTCKKQPEICGLRQQEKTYAPLKLMQAVTNEVNEICRRYLDNSRLALLPPPSSTPQVTVGSTRNARRKMEDRHMILHDLHTIFNIQDDTIANYYAVFDGHGGQDAAVYCATHLHQYLVESVHYPTDPEAALRDAFLTTDKQFIAKSNTQKLNGGTTAVCTLLLNKKLYIAWVGDSMASLVSQGNVNQLVNPHRPAREDENERIRNMGGVVVHCMGVLRVNGFLSISRAIGDVPYKPYVSGEPEVRCVSLDGTEDFLIIACDGLWDYVDQRTAALRVYRQVLQNPHDLKHVHQALLQSAKRAGSLDNITVIVVFLTPPVEIALRHSLLTHPAPNGLLLNSMDPNNPVSSNSGQFDMNAAFIKQQQLIDVELHDRADFEVNRAICGMARNGKHQDGDGNDDDYDYSDLGPETDVDAGEDSVDNHLSESFLISSSSSHEFTFLEKPPLELEIHNIDDGEQEDPLRRDNANVCPADSVLNDDHIKLSDRNKVRYDESNNDDDYHGGESRVVETTTSIGPHTFVDDDESPPSPQVVKSLQHALISEAENVADSEDSEDEWNYYRIDPNKKESAAVTTGESIEDIEKQSVQNPESVPRDSSEEVQSSKVEEVDIKCEGSEEKESPSLKLVNIDISYQKDSSESEKKDHGEKRKQADDDDKEDMDFQLNPEAAEFVPLSPPLLNNRNNALQDYPISGSPLKQTPAMDDILIPSQSEFEKEVCLRPKEIDEDFSSDDQQKHAAAACDNNLPDMDVSEISSTKAEVGDDSMARNVSTTQWQTDISQWSTTTRNDTGSDSEEYEIINRDTDPMTMSFTPGALEAAFEKSVDLNAVHELDDSSDDADDNTPPGSPSGQCVNENVLAHTPLSDDKGPIDLLSSSTPHPADNQSTRTATSESDRAKETLFSAFMVFKESMSTEQQLGVTPLADDRLPSQMEWIVSQPDHSQSTPHPVDNQSTRTATSESDRPKDTLFSAFMTFMESMSTQQQLGVTPLADDRPPSQMEFIVSQPDHSQSTPHPADNQSTRTVTSESDRAKDTLFSAFMAFKESMSTEQQLGVTPLADDRPPSQMESIVSQPDHSQSTPHPADNQSTRTATSESEGGKGTLFSAFMTFMESMSTQQQLGVTPLADDRPPTQMESIVSQPDHSQSTNPFEVDNNESLLMSSGHNYTRSSVFDVCTELDCGENLLMKEFDKTQNEGEQMDLREKVDETQFESRVTLSELVQFDSETELLIDQNQDTAILESDNQPSLSGTEYECEEAERPKKRNIDSVGQYLSIGEYEPPSSDLKEDFYPRKNKMLPNDEYLGFKVTLDFSDPAFRAAYDEKRKKEKDQDLKEPCNNHPDKFEKDDDDAAPNNTISSEESKEEETTNDEKQNQPEGQTREEDASSASKSLNNPQTEKIEDISFVKLQVCPVLCEKITLNSCEDISTGKEEETKRETAKATSSASKSSNNAQTEIIEDIPFVNVQARPSGICEAIRRIDLENVFTGFSDIEEETKAMAKVVESTVKAKATTTSTKRPAKTMATTTTKITSTTKTATKATPTSPSKAVSSITSSRTTATSQSATAKKSVAARPKQLTYGSARATVSSTSGKITGTKTTTSSNKTATTTVTTTATKTSVSPRVSTIKSRTNVTVTASSKLSASATSAEKKSTTNKVATTSAKPASTKTTTTTKTTALVANSLASTTAKTSTTSNATSKPRSTSAGTIAKTSLTTSVKSSTTSSRPKTAPSTVSGVKPRESSAKTTPAKSPLIDKQSKDTVNKQISRSSAGGTPSSKTGSRASASLVGNTAAKSRLSVGKSPGKVSETAISPTKKSSLTPKPVSKTTLGAKIASLTESSMMVQNGVPENQVVVEVSKTAVTTATSDKPEDDVPRKDASPVDVPTDNQLIVTD